jgi:N-acyl-D-amino-acid deacylase
VTWPPFPDAPMKHRHSATRDEITILVGGTIVDGMGTRPYPGEVAVAGGCIISVDGPGSSRHAARDGARVIDCAGCIVAPGFIDAHSHSDLQLLENRTEKLLQGVTTEVVGNCGFSPFPLPENAQTLHDFANGIFNGGCNWGWDSAASYLASASQSKVATVLSLVGHGSLRINVAGTTGRPLTSRELDRMVGLLDEALAQGAVGFSSGLMYAPGSGATKEELIALCRLTAKRGRIYATHMRSYSEGLIDAVEEQIAVAEASGCRLQISHLQAAGPDNWQLQRPALAAIELASRRGVDVEFDVYPWLAGSTVLTQILPQTALEGGIVELLGRLQDAEQREAIRAKIKPEATWERVVITSVAKDPGSLVGRSIMEIAEERGVEPNSAVLQILEEQEGNVNIVEHCQSIENLRELVTHPMASIVTDGVYTSGRSHPRLYGTFPLLLGELVREHKWLTLETAIHKITAQPAARFNRNDRGVLAEGLAADITVFEPHTIRTEATYENPSVSPTGIRYVFRNGAVAVDSGKVV